MLSFSSPAFASYNEPTLEDYQSVAKNTIQKYDMEEQMQYELLAIPHDKNLEQYSNYIDEMASTMAEQYSLYPEAFGASGDVVSPEPENMLQVKPKGSVQPRVMLVNKTRTMFKNYSGWFQIAATFVVTHNIEHPSYKWFSEFVDIFGSASFAGSQQGYVFSEVRDGRGCTFNAPKTVATCWVTGTYRVVYGTITEERGRITLFGEFEAS